MRGKYVRACTSDPINAKKSLTFGCAAAGATIASALARLLASVRLYDTFLHSHNRIGCKPLHHERL